MRLKKITLLAIITCSVVSAHTQFLCPMSKAAAIVEKSGIITMNSSRISDDISDKLIEDAVSTHSNIFLYDEKGILIDEIHSDGYAASYEYGKDTVKVNDTQGNESIYEYEDEKYVNKTENGISIQSNLFGDNLIFSASYLSLAKSKSAAITKDNYIVKGKKMNTILSNSEFLFDAKKSWTKAKIQNFLKKKNSVLQHKITIYALNNKKKVYNTGRTIQPAKIIYDSAKKYGINPKVILATIQKESSLITTGNKSKNTRSFYYAMGCGATDNGDLTSYTGFDNQIFEGTRLLKRLYNKNPRNKTITVHGGKRIKINGVTYPEKITAGNSASYALYQYTPHVFDPAYTKNITGGNYLFYQIYKGWGWIC